MPNLQLKVGRIDYLNIWPLFHCIEQDRIVKNIRFLSGHPAQLNQGLARKQIHVSPSSSIEYLFRAENYMLLPDLSISAENRVQSVLFCLPFSRNDLIGYVRDGGSVSLSSASDTSCALLRVLWHFYWQLPAPRWEKLKPGRGLDTGKPFLEIGDHALRLCFDPPPGWRIVDLAAEWKKMTGLPFVFALWIMNRDLNDPLKEILRRLKSRLLQAKEDLPFQFPELCYRYTGKGFNPEQIMSYWQNMNYGLGPEQLAGLTAFSNYLTQLKVIQGMPALDFFT